MRRLKPSELPKGFSLGSMFGGFANPTWILPGILTLSGESMRRQESAWMMIAMMILAKLGKFGPISVEEGADPDEFQAMCDRIAEYLNRPLDGSTSDGQK